MDRGTLETLIGNLVNDPSHDRYTTAMIDEELDNTQDLWNINAKIVKDSVAIDTVSGTRQYALSGLTGTPIWFTRVTHKGLELKRKDKSFMDLYTGDDWTDDTGTPKYYIIEATDPDSQYITLYPTPSDNDAGTGNLVVEYIKEHTSMASSTDTPFNGNTFTTPYHMGLAYEVASRLLSRDPTNENVKRAADYRKVGDDTLSSLVQTFKDLERESPIRLRGGRVWQS